MVSIIVTIYNAELYLKKCVASLCNQTFDEIEIILVDDGSTDTSSIIIDEYAKNDSRIVVIHKENEGETSARKAGLDVAKGEYILFVDSDDWIEKEAVEKLYKKAILDDADIVAADWKIHDGETIYDALGIIEEGIYQEENKEYFAKNMIYTGNVQSQGVNASMNTKLYRTVLIRKMLKNLPNGIVYAEDDFLVYATLANARCISVMHYPFYHYLMRYDSVSHSKNGWYLKDLNEGYRYFIKAIAETDYYYIYKMQIEIYMQRAIYHGMGKYLEFEDEINLGWYTYDVSKIRNSRVIIYGAGKVGRCYYNSLIKDTSITVVGWTDKQYEFYATNNKNIKSVEVLKNEDFDYVLIAVDSKKLAEKICEELIDKYAIPSKKIIWEKPYNDIDKRLSMALMQ